MELKKRKTFFILVGTILFALLISLKILPFANSFPLIKPEKIFSELSLNKNRKAKKVEETEFSSEKSFQVSERNISQASMKIQAKKAQPDSKPITLLSSTIRRGDTIYRLLRKAGVSPQKSYFLLKSLKKVFTPRDCKPGDRIKLLKSTEDGRIIFKYFPGGLNYYLVEEIQPNKFSASVQKLVAEKISQRTGKKIRVGKYVHIADSYHIYGSDYNQFKQFLETLKKRKFEERTWPTSFALPFFEEGRKRLKKEN